MPTASYIKIPAANEDLLEAGQAQTDTWAVALTNTVPGGKAFTAGTTDLVTGGGYTQGGATVGVNSSGMIASDFVLVLANPATWTATGGGFTFRYALLLNSTRAVMPGYWDYGSSQVVAAGETVVVGLDQTNGVFKVT